MSALTTAAPSYTDIPDLQQLLRRFRGERTLSAALGMENQLYWAGPSGPDASDGFQISTSAERANDEMTAYETNDNQFALWIRGKGPEPTEGPSKRC